MNILKQRRRRESDQLKVSGKTLISGFKKVQSEALLYIIGCNQSNVQIICHSIGGIGITKTKRLATFWKYEIFAIDQEKPLVEPERQSFEFQVKLISGSKYEKIISFKEISQSFILLAIHER